MQDFNFAAEKPELIEFEPQPDSGRQIVQVLSSGPDSPEKQIKTAYVKAIYGARKRVYIQTPYFIPDDSFKEALIAAAQSGVDVRIMIPGFPDKKYVYLCTTYYMKELLPYGIKFYMWNGFIHSKTLIVDDEIVSIGTFNIDIRSFKLHFEMTAFLYGEEINTEMTRRFEHDIENSKEVPADYKSPPFRQFLENLMRLFTPLM
jgi:cardiolipin synthase